MSRQRLKVFFTGARLLSFWFVIKATVAAGSVNKKRWVVKFDPDFQHFIAKFTVYEPTFDYFAIYGGQPFFVFFFVFFLGREFFLGKK